MGTLAEKHQPEAKEYVSGATHHSAGARAGGVRHKITQTREYQTGELFSAKSMSITLGLCPKVLPGSITKLIETEELRPYGLVDGTMMYFHPVPRKLTLLRDQGRELADSLRRGNIHAR